MADLPAARAALDKLIAGLASEPFAEAELQRVKAQELNGYERLMNSSQQVAADLSENVAAGDWRLLFWDRDQMGKVTTADVQRVARVYLITSNLTVGTFIPEEKPLRAVDSRRTVAHGHASGLYGKQGSRSRRALRGHAGQHRGAHAARTIGTLKTAFLERKSRGGRVSGVVRLHFGDLQSLQNLGDVGRLTGAMLMRGTQKHTRQQLQDELTRLKATLGVSGDADGAVGVIRNHS